MPVMMKDVNSWEEEMANIKAIVQKLTRSVKRRKHTSSFKRKNIAKLAKKLEKVSTQSSTKYSKSEEEENQRKVGSLKNMGLWINDYEKI